MTKDEAIRILEQICPKRPQKLWSVKRKEAVKMAIEALTHFNSTSNSIKNELNELSCSEKPNRSDTIYRQDAIDACKHAWAKGLEPSQYIELIPSAQPEQRWIPCERELPEVGRSILISVGGMYTAEGCLRDDGDWTQFRWDAIQRKDMVGAWQPLPSPYTQE